MVLEERAAEIFDGGPIPSPYMLFTHRVKPEWLERIPAVVHVDGTARIQTVSPEREPAVARTLRAFERRTGVPVDALVIGPYILRRPGSEAAARAAAEVVAG